MSRNKSILKKEIRNVIDIKKTLEEQKEKEAKANKFWHSSKGRILILIGTPIAVILCILAFISFHAFGFLIYGSIILICGIFFFCRTFPNNKKDDHAEQENRISKDEISLMEKSLKKPHLEYQDIAITDSGIIDLKSFHRIKYNNIAWVYQTEDNTSIIPVNTVLSIATVLDFGMPISNNDYRTYLVLRTKDDKIAYLGDHKTHSNGLISATRKTYKCSKEFEEFREALLEKCPNNAIYGNNENNEREYYKRIGKPMPKNDNSILKEQEEDIDDGL